MDGLILPDVPFEEKEEFDSVCRKVWAGLYFADRTDIQRPIQMIAKEAAGFVYCVSSLG